MENEELNLEKELENDEDLLNFDLDDLSDEMLADESADSEEEEIIELVNLVEKGPEVEAQGDEEISSLLDDDGAAPEQEEIEALATDEIEALDQVTDEESPGLSDTSEDMDLADLSLSDLEVEGEPAPEEGPVGEEIHEEDLSGLLEEETEEGPAADLQGEGAVESADVPEGQDLTEADLEMMLEEEQQK